MIFEERKIIFLQIAEERAAQDEEWGGHKHDSGHSGNDWISYIAKQAGKAGTAWNAHVANGHAEDKGEYRQRMIKIAALAVAAIEALD